MNRYPHDLGKHHINQHKSTHIPGKHQVNHHDSMCHSGHLPHLQHVPLHIGPRGQDARVSLDDLKGLPVRKKPDGKSHGNHMEIMDQAYLNISAIIFLNTIESLKFIEKIQGLESELTNE